MRSNLGAYHERGGGLGPLAPRRGAGTYDDRMSAGRGDERGVGYRKTRHFLRNYEGFHEHSQPHSPASPRPVRSCSAWSLEWEHGARGPTSPHGLSTTRVNRRLEVPFWNIKLGRHPQATPRVHRTGRGDVVERPSQQTGSGREHRDHARFRSHPGAHRRSRRSESASRCSGSSLRRAIQHGVRCDPGSDQRRGPASKADRFSERRTKGILLRSQIVISRLRIPSCRPADGAKLAAVAANRKELGYGE